MILREGRNCWRIAQARRAAFLVDADEYFSAARQAMAGAQHTIFIVGWDVDTRVRLGPPRPSDGRPPTLLPFLNSVLADRPGLRVFVLGWDFSMIYTLERERLPRYQFAWRGNSRLHFALDGVHPFGASHHQKVVVVDDRVAFAGGLDLTIRRWDTRRHEAVDTDRTDPAGKPYPPVHDVQMAVDGDAARALGELVRARWAAATGSDVPFTEEEANPGHDPWPGQLAPSIRNVPVGISRTTHAGDAPVRDEVLNLTRDAIAAARSCIYIENQYLTSAAVGSALAARLNEDQGPEVVIVVPREETGWLEQSSMGIMRARLLRRLRAADRHRRLLVCYPTTPNLGPRCVNVHAKVLVIDDRLVRIGSSNLSNRSMGVDSECDLVIDGDDDLRLRATIAEFRDGLLAEHLGTKPQQVVDTLAARGSLLATVHALRGNPRTLTPLPEAHETARDDEPPIHLAVFDGLVCDPERPATERLLADCVPPELRPPVHRSLRGYALALLVLVAVAALWRLTPLRTFLDIETIAAYARTVRQSPIAPLLVLGAYLGGALIFFPITLLLAATALVFDPVRGLIYGLLGGISGAVLTYGVGRALGHRRVQRLAGPRVTRLREQLQRRALLAVVVARILPVGNFSIINMIAGALTIPFRAFVLGNLIGLSPGILGLTLFADRLGDTLRNPRPSSLLVLAGVVLVIVGAMRWLRRRLARMNEHVAPVDKNA